MTPPDASAAPRYARAALACIRSVAAIRAVAVTGSWPVTLYVAGSATFAFGVWLAWHPAGFMVSGAIAVNAGLKLAAAVDDGAHERLESSTRG